MSTMPTKEMMPESNASTDGEQQCDKNELPAEKDGRYWNCEFMDEREPKYGDQCRMECKDDKVVEHEVVFVCTPLGWQTSLMPERNDTSTPD